jgi:hypothetical protein
VPRATLGAGWGVLCRDCASWPPRTASKAAHNAGHGKRDRACQIKWEKESGFSPALDGDVDDCGGEELRRRGQGRRRGELATEAGRGTSDGPMHASRRGRAAALENSAVGAGGAGREWARKLGEGCGGWREGAVGWQLRERARRGRGRGRSGGCLRGEEEHGIALAQAR